jgi:hypothetical protein
MERETVEQGFAPWLGPVLGALVLPVGICRRTGPASSRKKCASSQTGEAAAKLTGLGMGKRTKQFNGTSDRLLRATTNFRREAEPS